ncbi:MAG: hypothetical protein Q4A17_01385 [Thermoguttaceae bacterium]|nr:hypothetical protein [Thermoguttaceae bacterium]
MSNLENRIIQYVQKLPPAVQGEGGQTVLFSAASKLVEGFDLTAEQVTGFLWDYYNPRCVPPWNDGNTADFIHQCEAAWKKAPAERGRLLKPGELSQAVKAPAFPLVRPGTRSGSGTGSGSQGSEILIHKKNGIEEQNGKKRFWYSVTQVPDVFINVPLNPQTSKYLRAFLFEYRDGSGNLYQLWKRIEWKEQAANGKPKKSFRAYHYETAAGGYIRGGGGLPPIPWRLPGLKSAQGVFIVEGEKAAFRLNAFLARWYWKQGVLAVCFPNGAGAWKPEYSEYFRGKDVFIWPDNDSAGFEYARRAARSLLGVARNVDALAYYPNHFSEKSDAVEVIDYFDGYTGGRGEVTARTLAALVREMFFDFRNLTPVNDWEGIRYGE